MEVKVSRNVLPDWKYIPGSGYVRPHELVCEAAAGPRGHHPVSLGRSKRRRGVDGWACRGSACMRSSRRVSSGVVARRSVLNEAAVVSEVSNVTDAC
eukprot:351133-Chlamydomonas_euryale.AAC.12